jgi:hypothetical protein
MHNRKRAALISFLLLFVFARGGLAVAGTHCHEPKIKGGSGDEKKTGADGSSCEALSDGGPADATASGVGSNPSVAFGSADVFGNGKANATSGGNAHADGEDGGTATAVASKDGNAFADALGDHPGNQPPGPDKTKSAAIARDSGVALATSDTQSHSVASAVGVGSFASAEASQLSADGTEQASVSSLAIANGVTGGVATSKANFGSVARSNANSGGLATATSDQRGRAIARSIGGTSTATSLNGLATAISQIGGTATAESDNACITSARATSGGTAKATCNSDVPLTGPSIKVIAKATGGGIATGSDTDPPICDTSAGPGATAKVTSPMGNCSLP